MGAIVLEGVSKAFRQVDAVRNLSFEVRRGSIFGLLGPNGAGKTTTIRMIVDILAPDSGTIRLLGERFTPSMKVRIGYLPEERGLYKDMKVRELLLFFAALRGIEVGEARRRVDRWLERLHLGDWAHRQPGELSKGMAQKVQFIAAVLHAPEVLILDEPFSGFDPVNVHLLQGVVFELRTQGTTILFSTHQMEHVEQMCDDICLLDRGVRVLGGSLREIKRRFGTNMLLLDFDGPESFLSGAMVQSVRRYATHFEVRLREGEDPQELLRLAFDSGAQIKRFELVEPSLHNIFFSTVGGTA